MNPALFWLVLGLALVGLEIILPGIVLMFFGFGALLTSLCCLLFGIDPLTQTILFAVSSVIMLAALRRLFLRARWFAGEKTKDEFAGKEVKVVADIPGTAEHGLVLLNGTNWNAIAREFIPKDSIVRIERRDGLTLVVSQVNPPAKSKEESL